jgi:HAD superfamily hydrolase (TIGR01509 family)
MSKIKAVLFDMDGVLIDAKDWHYEALNRALGLFGMDISRYDHLVTYDGLPTIRKLQMLSLERGLPSKLHEFINAMKQQYTMEIVYSKCKPVYRHEYALSRLQTDGYRLAVCSNSVRATIEIMMERANLKKYLDFHISAQDVGNGKPDPEIYLASISRLGLEPQECLILEDNENGIKAAIASGANLMRIAAMEDVNYQQIKQKISEIEEGKC